MSKKLRNPLQIFNVALFISVLGLTFYNSVYVPQRQEGKLTTIYLAKEDINPNVNLSENMFIPTKIATKDVLPNYVTDVSLLNDSYSSSSILKNEPLMITRLTDSEKSEGNYEIKLEPNFSSALEKDDYVQVFIQLVNKNTKESSIYTLFDKKQIKSINYVDESLGTVSGVYVNVTEDELKDYYTAKQKGMIILGKIKDVAVDTNAPAKIDFNSEEFKNAETIEDTANTEGNELIEVTVKEGDTINSLAEQYEVSVDEIRNLNLGVENVVPGQVITLPNNLY